MSQVINPTKKQLAEMTLWEVCLNTYFPQRVTIRSYKTQRQYHFAVNDFGRFLDRVPRVSDLNDENLTGMLAWLLSRGRAPKTSNERVGRLRTLWSWLCKRGHLRRWPTVERCKEPRKLPQAWSEQQLQRLFWSCSQEDLAVGDIPGHLWWLAWHALAWNTSERLGALLAARWEDFDSEACTLFIPAHVRKGGMADMLYRLWPETVETVQRIREPRRELILPWVQTESNFYHRYNRILFRANLPTDRRSKAHRMRVSHATHVRATTGFSASSLGHASEETTRRHYEDPRICKKDAPKLFIPWQPKSDDVA